MTTQKAISANAIKHVGGTVLHGGNVDGSNITNNLTMATNAHHPVYGSKVLQAVEVGSSGNLGTTRPISDGVFGKMETAQYVGKIIGTRIAQTDNTTLKSGAGDWGIRHPIHFKNTDRRLDESSWDYVTGAVTKGGSEGDSMTFNADHAATPTVAIPGELVYMVTGKTPTQDDYKSRA